MLEYYRQNNCAIFPLPYGSKDPTGIVASFARDFSADPAQWDRWHAAHKCNFGLVAGPSQLIVVDVDVKEIGRDAAWAEYCNWFTSRGLQIYQPHVATPSGGWHIYFRLPDDAPSLRQIPLIGPCEGSKNAIADLRVGNGYVVAAGSYYDGTAKGKPSGYYTLISDAPPYPAPEGLIEHCTRVERSNEASVAKAGSYDKADVADLLRWLNEQGAFADYEGWLQAGMALRAEYGDDGLELWRITHDATVTDDVESTKWRSFKTEAIAGGVTLASLMREAHATGWKGQLRQSAASMFGDVVPVASSGAVSLMGGTQAIVDVGTPIVAAFNASVTNFPSTNAPLLPDGINAAPLRDPLNVAIGKMVSLAGTQRGALKFDAIGEVLSVLALAHEPTFTAVVQQIRATGAVLPEGRLKNAIASFESQVQRETRSAQGWIVDSKGCPDPKISENVDVLLGRLDAELRFNEFADRIEFRRGDNSWRTLHEERDVDAIVYEASSVAHRFHVSRAHLKACLTAIARRTTYDPLVDWIDSIRWDGKPRLLTWLSQVCGVPCDPYHQSVGKNVIGGMVRRARHPGCKHDEVLLLIGLQGSLKSTLVSTLVPFEDWLCESIDLRQSPQNLIPQLAGKWVVEWSELAGMSKADVEDIKSFISRRSDNYTKKYASFAADHPRRCIFIATSNDATPLRDETGNRRFLPVHVRKDVDIEWLKNNVEQLIGEAATREAAGESFAIPREIWSIATEHQEAAREATPAEDLIASWFGKYGLEPIYVTATDIGEAMRRSGLHRNLKIGKACERVGLDSRRIYLNGVRQRVWIRASRHENECLRIKLATNPLQIDWLVSGHSPSAQAAGTGQSAGQFQ